MGAEREPWPQRYQIRVRGRLGRTICSAFPALRAQAEGGDTVLTGVLADRANPVCNRFAGAITASSRWDKR
jgi:hypothetical protein